MRIAASSLQFDATHQRRDQAQDRVELRTWNSPDVAPRPDTLSLSERAIQASALPSPLDTQAALSPTLAMIKQVIEDLFGVQIDLPSMPADAVASTDAQADPPATGTAVTAAATAPIPRRPTDGAGFELRLLRTREQTERTNVQVQGTVQTQDGRRIALNLSLDLYRVERQTQTLSMSGGTPAPQRKDPLVINLSAPSVALGEGRMAFDLDGDGLRERIPVLDRASGFLALDRNGNGRIDDGHELFGAQSGNGFADLATLDDDGNGWIDQTDAAWGALRIWRPDAQGRGDLQTLAQAGVGALHTGQAASTFELRDGQGAAAGELRGTGVYLRESGTAGTLQQLDFFV